MLTNKANTIKEQPSENAKNHHLKINTRHSGVTIFGAISSYSLFSHEYSKSKAQWHIQTFDLDLLHKQCIHIKICRLSCSLSTISKGWNVNTQDLSVAINLTTTSFGLHDLCTKWNNKFISFYMHTSHVKKIKVNFRPHHLNFRFWNSIAEV